MTVTLFKGVIWTAFVVLVLMLGAFVFNLMPYALAPFYGAWTLSQATQSADPDAIQGRMNDSERARRIDTLREITASPQAAATSADFLTIIGIRFNRLREVHPDVSNSDGKSETPTLARESPFPIKLDLSRTNRHALVSISDPAISWTIVTPPAGQNQAVFGVESRLFPHFPNAAQGVLAGFKIGDMKPDSVAKAVNPHDGATRQDIWRLCRSLADWAQHFSVPRNSINYVLLEDPTQISFGGDRWTFDGETQLGLDSGDLTEVCDKPWR